MKRRKSANQRDKPATQTAKVTLKHEWPSLSDYWEFGGKAMESLSREYGGNDVTRFAKTSGQPPRTVYACLKFRELWPDKIDLKRVMKLGLLFSHVKELSHSQLTPEERRELEGAGLSVRSLQARIRVVTEGRPRPKKRRALYKDLGDI